MTSANSLEIIEKQIINLPIAEQIYLIERIARRVRFVPLKERNALNLNDLYGAGKGIWQEDAQDYVNNSRQRRGRC